MTSPGVRPALRQYPLGGERQWVAFDAPFDTIVAEELRDVPDAKLDQVGLRVLL